MNGRKIGFSIVAVVAIMVATYGLSVVRRGFSARAKPSAVEEAVARAARNLATPAADRNKRNPFSETPEIIEEAETHFADHCAICHGNDGTGRTEIGQNLYPKPPDMRQPATQNLTDGQIYSIVHNGIRLTGMPAWGDPDRDDDSWKLVLFIRHLPRITPRELKHMEEFNPKSSADRSEEEDEKRFLDDRDAPEMTKHMHHSKGDRK
ncbi:MAG: hypothetical protein NVS9B4_28210 [Candidatus Acidiferrum sp.]